MSRTWSRSPNPSTGRATVGPLTPPSARSSSDGLADLELTVTHPLRTGR